MRAYLMHSDYRWFLCFGNDAMEAARGMEVHGIHEHGISVSQSGMIEPGTAVEVDCLLLAPLFKTFLGEQ